MSITRDQHHHPNGEVRGNRRSQDGGFALIEILITIIILGILAAVVVLAVGNMTANAEETGCAADRKTLYTAYEVYAIQTGTAVIPSTPAASGRTGDQFEQTLHDLGFLSGLSVMHDLDADGGVMAQAGSSC